mmetsp:Transcript_15915/g.39237  ORF Transcript_15915/g.39237 Transcript_15915/m.39237 type:complete len:112 (+) Transcript_15915:815-1150(+)
MCGLSAAERRALVLDFDAMPEGVAEARSMAHEAMSAEASFIVECGVQGTDAKVSWVMAGMCSKCGCRSKRLVAKRAGANPTELGCWFRVQILFKYQCVGVCTLCRYCDNNE